MAFMLAVCATREQPIGRLEKSFEHNDLLASEACHSRSTADAAGKARGTTRSC